jgi:hypothetical protein
MKYHQGHHACGARGSTRLRRHDETGVPDDKDVAVEERAAGGGQWLHAVV